jgi:hypothetical protein
MSDNFAKESRRDWVNNLPGNPNIEQLSLGCLQRIADAVEMSCKDREKFERDIAYLRKSRDGYKAEAERIARSNAALRVVIARMKRKAKEIA